MNRVEFTTYCSVAVENRDFDFEKCCDAEMVFSVPYNWLQEWIKENEYLGVDNFLDSYIYDDSQQVFNDAKKDGVEYIHGLDCSYCREQLYNDYPYLEMLHMFKEELKILDIYLKVDEEAMVIERILDHKDCSSLTTVIYGEKNVSLECEDCMNTLIDSDILLEGRQ